MFIAAKVLFWRQAESLKSRLSKLAVEQYAYLQGSRVPQYMTSPSTGAFTYNHMQRSAELCSNSRLSVKYRRGNHGL